MRRRRNAVAAAVVTIKFTFNGRKALISRCNFKQFSGSRLAKNPITSHRIFFLSSVVVTLFLSTFSSFAAQAQQPGSLAANSSEIVQLTDSISVVPDAGGSQQAPRICTGFRPDQNTWGRSSIQGKLSLCPKNHAIFALEGPLGLPRTAENMPISTSCCPLPSTDILLNQQLTSSAKCPDGYVATGGVQPKSHACWHCLYPIHCTKINTQRYQLAEARPGASWGPHGSDYFWKESRRYKRADIPIALRYGAARISKYHFIESGCIGEPFGSLLVEKSTKRCKGYYFRQLQFVGASGDPSRGTAVRMLPDCRFISTLFGPNPECITN